MVSGVALAHAAALGRPSVGVGDPCDPRRAILPMDARRQPGCSNHNPGVRLAPMDLQLKPEVLAHCGLGIDADRKQVDAWWLQGGGGARVELRRGCRHRTRGLPCVV